MHNELTCNVKGSEEAYSSAATDVAKGHRRIMISGVIPGPTREAHLIRSASDWISTAGAFLAWMMFDKGATFCRDNNSLTPLRMVCTSIEHRRPLAYHHRGKERSSSASTIIIIEVAFVDDGSCQGICGVDMLEK